MLCLRCARNERTVQVDHPSGRIPYTKLLGFLGGAQSAPASKVALLWACMALKQAPSSIAACSSFTRPFSPASTLHTSSPSIQIPSYYTIDARGMDVVGASVPHQLDEAMALKLYK